MSMHYSDPKRENDPYALPDIEVFYDDADIGHARNYARNYDSEGDPVAPGWYWWSCFPGCLPDGDATGPFATEEEALADAQEGFDD